MSEAVEKAQGNEIPGEKQQEARAQGWAPKEEWHGPADKWVDADTFLKRGEEIKGVLKERNGHLSRELREVRQLLLEQRDMAQKAKLAGYQQALEDIQRRQRAAAESADVEAYDAAERDRSRVIQQVQEEQKASPSVDHDFEDWQSDNDWFEADPDMRAYAIGVSAIVQSETKLGGRKLYDEVTKRVKKTFPHKFGNPRRTDPGAVEPGAQAPAPKKSGKTFDDLPAESKVSYERQARQFKQMGINFSKEEYLANYIWG